MSNIDPRTLFPTWAPESSRWSPWAKPVLFTYPTPIAYTPLPAAELAPERAPSPNDRVAVVVDMPGAQSVACGMVLAARGFRPIPLFNTTIGMRTNLHDVGAVISALVDSSAPLASLRLADDAPPAFLIDSSRLDGTPAPSSYDNRWMVFPQDFPSARALTAAGLESVLVIRRDGQSVKPDLRAVLRYWKRDGIASSALDPDTGQRNDLWFDTTMLAVLTDHFFSWFSGLRRNSAGGFGGAVPEPQAASGGGFG